MLELAIQTHLLSKTAITNAIGSRVWLGATDPIDAELPDVIFEVDTDFEPTFDGEAEDLQFPVVVFTSRATLPSIAIGLNDLVRRSIKELKSRTTIATTSGPVEIVHANILGQSDNDAKFRRDGSQRVVYQRELLVQFAYRFDVSPVE